ncbi:MAG: YHYH protein [Verrucomicrobiota bacterium]
MPRIKGSILCLLLSTIPSLFAHVGDQGMSAPPTAVLTARLDYDSEVSITESGNKRIIKSNGIPNHRVGRFPNPGNPNRITPQNHNYQMPLKPRENSRFTRYGGIFGIAVNGVPFEPGTAETWKGDRNWREEAIVKGKRRLGLDDSNAHVQPTGAYHYHSVPWGLIKQLRKSGVEQTPLLIGWAADGFPIYFDKGAKSSWQLKSGKRSGGPGGRHDGTYTADYEYVAGSGHLDEANGREGTTTEYPEGTYYYCITEDFPFLGRVSRGTRDSSFQQRRGGPGGPGGQRPNGPGGNRPPHPPGHRPPHPF